MPVCAHLDCLLAAFVINLTIACTQGIGWVRCGHNVCYGANSIVCRKKATYYTLHFEVEFPHDKDLVHLAHCYPFTWTDQQNHIYALKQVRLRGVGQSACMSVSMHVYVCCTVWAPPCSPAANSKQVALFSVTKWVG